MEVLGTQAGKEEPDQVSMHLLGPGEQHDAA